MIAAVPARVSRDPSVDAAIVYLADGRPRSVRTVELDEDRLVDYGADGATVFIELHEVSAGVHLAGLPEPARVRAALTAAGIAIRG